LPLHRIAFSGSHGRELQLADGTRLPLSVPVGLADVRAKVEDFAALTPGLLVEEKPAGIALHYRLAAEEGPRADAFLAALAKEHGLEVQRGAMVVELRPTGATKGDAIRAFMMEPQFADARPLFMGDDLTDEHGFAAAAALGGAGILVGPARKSAARYRLGSVAEARRWLREASA
jgi:trehalose 6-phosphate phosphatase